MHEAEVEPVSEVGEQVIAEEATPVLAEEATHTASHEPVLADETVEEVAEEAAPIAAHEPVAAEEPEPVVAEAAAAVPSEEPVVAAEAAASIEPEVQKKPIVPEPAPQVESPWWLNQPSPRRERVRPPVLWKPARVWMPQPSDVSSSPSPTSPDTDPKGSAGNGSSPHHDLPTATGTSDQIEEASETLTSRLSGLRNLLFVMGVKNPHGSDEGSVRNHSADPSFRNEGPAEVLYPDPKRMATPSNIGDASPKLVTAPPQFLPPQPVVIKVDREEGASASEPPARFAPRSSFDGMELLQPKRGQFKS